MKTTFPLTVLSAGIAAAFAYFVAPEWLNLPLISFAVVMGALLLGALAVYLAALKVVVRERTEVRSVSRPSAAMICFGAALLVSVSAVTGGGVGKAAAVTAPVLGLLCASVAAWSVKRHSGDRAV
jgi:hypothetical protein